MSYKLDFFDSMILTDVFPPSMTGDLNALRLILLYHFSNGIFINGGLEGGVTNLLKTLQGNNLQVLSVRKATTELSFQTILKEKDLMPKLKGVSFSYFCFQLLLLFF